ncbi:MAG: 2Fe-2S iron-sulfur cluster binding domain-containing protein [Gammaproteobacteria bacterium]|nr:2Fe-2S iron-sulfur cluster binding domain-containing protein [Gammaproteobacteria bacterium]
MPHIHFEGKSHPCQDDESVLDCLTRHGVAIPSSCRSGVCQTCLMRAVEGQVPEAAQQGLKETLRTQNYFLACACKPKGDLGVARPDVMASARTQVTVLAKEILDGNIIRLRLGCPLPLDYRPGQFLHLHRADGLVRSYSIASLPQSEEPLELHVRHLAGGRMSGWINNTLQVGDTLEVSQPAGQCFYLPGQPEQGLLLIGTGSGLAPLWGIARDALAQGHTGPIHLYHGSHGPDGLYLVQELRALARRYPNFHYTPCVSGLDVPEGYATGRAEDIAFSQLPKLAGWRVFLCGHPGMVAKARKKAFLSGASMKDIYADPFVLAPDAAQSAA